MWVPLLVFVGLIGLVASELMKPSDRTVRSQLIGQPLPEFQLGPAVPGKPGLATASFRQGQPRLLNIFASWCVPCAAEAPQLMALKRAGVTIDAIAIRDKPGDIAQFLTRYGDPYASIGGDEASAVQLALGSSGVPESFVVDGQGRILLQHVGDIRPDDVPEILAALGRAK